ncbi:hypothetical protein K435DRAFT_860117 [Dendrothele bispora CBS 962.96]|uniref:protein-tyrosine-phosphatase n=1 Tax=Dendrothele bispora (strain CBS 962.96) TaxID=1314807 RepID=A0A4S8LZ17_DENBC|nr:hypothetical protein K435DRAFT_860117 [Dendrothele bispora CBS 962.96]
MSGTGATTTTTIQRKKPLRPLSIAATQEKLPIAVVADTDDEVSPRPRSLRNLKQLSITLPSSAHSSTQSLALSDAPLPSASLPRPRRPSVISLPSSANPTASSLLHRKEEVGEPAVPYVDGPIQIIPGIWLGSEDNARDWTGLMERGIKSVLNVAKEVSSPFDSNPAPALRSTVSTPNLNKSMSSEATYHPPNLAIDRPGMHYLKLMWSHGQSDLVANGFSSAMDFTDAALARGEGVLVHCQCGISRSATLVIAIVMRAAAERSPSVPPEVWALKGMQGAYDFVKEKSKWIGPNMSLIYQLLEYEKKFKGDCGSPTSDRSSLIAEEEAEWGRRRRLLDDEPSDDDEEERQSSIVLQEAQALDKAMEDRIVARKASASSLGSSNGVGMGAAWRSRYGHGRKRTGSAASSIHTTSNSIISEDLVEEDEEPALLGVGASFDESSVDRDMSSATNSPEEDNVIPVYSSKVTSSPKTARPPPSAPVRKTSFDLPPPATAFRSTFDLSTPKTKRRPAPLGILPAVPPSPIAIIVESNEPSPTKATLAVPPSPKQPTTPFRKTTMSLPPLPPMRARTVSRRPAPPPLHLRNAVPKSASKPVPPPFQVSTPSQSQTLFLFPPSPTLTTRTPSTMTLTSSTGPVPFPSLTTPRVSTFRSHGRTRSFIGLGAPPTPTTGFSKVDVRGYVGLE